VALPIDRTSFVAGAGWNPATYHYSAERSEREGGTVTSLMAAGALTIALLVAQAGVSPFNPYPYSAPSRWSLWKAAQPGRMGIQKVAIR
jgi:hypothetical protein